MRPSSRRRSLSGPLVLCCISALAQLGGCGGGGPQDPTNGAKLTIVRYFPDETHFMRSTDALEVQFSAPLDAGSIHAGVDCVHVEVAGAPLEVTVSVTGANADTIHIQPTAPPPFDTNLLITADVKCVRAKFGNAWTGEGATWPALIRGWVPTAAGATFARDIGPLFVSCSPSFSLTSDGSAILACEQSPVLGPDVEVLVERELGGAAPGWMQLGGPVGAMVLSQRLQQLALDPSDRPIVAYSHPVGSSADLLVARFDGAAWQPLGGTLNTNGQLVSATLTVDPSGRPVVAWSKDASEIFVSRWNGAAWEALGASLGGTAAKQFTAASLAIAPDGNPAIAVYAFERMANGTNALTYPVLKWDGAAWGPIGAPIPASVAANGVPTLVFDASGAPVLLRGDLVQSRNAIIVARFDGAAWRPLGAPFVTATEELRPFLVAGAGKLVLVRAMRTPTVEPPPGSPAAGYTPFEWNGSAWTPHAPTLTRIDTPNRAGEETAAFAMHPSGRLRAARAGALNPRIGTNLPIHETTVVWRPND